MASPPIKPLDGHGGYLRWKESLLLRAHTLGVARVLFDARPADDGDAAAAKKWARDDAVCRGHILAALSDRLLPDYARFSTAADLWRALERTYDVQVESNRRDEFREFFFDHSTGEVFLEQLAHAEALGAAAGLSDGSVAFGLQGKLPWAVTAAVVTRSGSDEKEMELVWKVARKIVSAGVDPEHLWALEMEDHEDGCYDDGPKPEQNMGSRKRGMSGNVSRNCRRWA
ncbi:unnamed protein product [Urochloa decumbens]|uniref:Retrotransposon protein, putative, Ty1-copia subclass n=1 Tax=Urochloa decumbens TaxID=240449 RepID=A0ABC9BRV2_9POAL